MNSHLRWVGGIIPSQNMNSLLIQHSFDTYYLRLQMTCMTLLSFPNAYPQLKPSYQDKVSKYAYSIRPLSPLAPPEYHKEADRHSRSDIWRQS